MCRRCQQHRAGGNKPTSGAANNNAANRSTRGERHHGAAGNARGRHSLSNQETHLVDAAQFAAFQRYQDMCDNEIAARRTSAVQQRTASESKTSRQFRGDSLNAGFIVKRGRSEYLLSFNSSVKIKIVTVVKEIDETAKQPPLTASIKSKFSSVFSGRLGYIRGHQVLLRIDFTHL